MANSRLGKHKEFKKRDFDKIQLEKGINVEKEHTDLDKYAMEIAKDHLVEIPDYYDRLEYIERENFWAIIEKSRQGIIRTKIECPNCSTGMFIEDRDNHLFYCNNKECNYTITNEQLLIEHVEKVKN
jgi:ribosomal protein S27AE